MFVVRLWLLLLAAWVVSAATPTRTSQKRAPSNFVTTENGKFMLNGKPFRFVGTNAYWLPTLLSDDDIDFTLGNMSAAGIRVVRTWAFNDVEEIPAAGTWFQLVANGTTQINDGPNGLQKLDTVLRLAEKHKIHILLSLTNNWNPGTNKTARNTLSNDYGGMDTYVRNFVKNNARHDEFYTNTEILKSFTNYISHVVQRYANSSALLAWELANDPRCSSSLPASDSCNPQTITRWHSQIAQVVKTIDSNHLCSSGNQGFQCVGCPKLFPTTPSPQPSAAPGRRRSVNTIWERTLERRKLSFQQMREAQERGNPAKPIRIRGRWVTPELRQLGSSSSAIDGSQGVDSEDITNIPQIGFSTFAFFPDQFKYSTDNPSLSPFDNTVQQGTDWIRRQAATATSSGKPVLMDAFGLVTTANVPAFVPFDSTTQPSPLPSTLGVTDSQRNDAYGQWFQAALDSGVQGMLHYQWSQPNLMASPGTNIVPTVPGTGTVPIVPGTGLSPNDGYATQGVGQTDFVETIREAAQNFGADS